MNFIWHKASAIATLEGWYKIADKYMQLAKKWDNTLLGQSWAAGEYRRMALSAKTRGLIYHDQYKIFNEGIDK